MRPGVDFIDRIREGCQRMAQLIDDLLKLSRLSRSEMNRQPVNLSKIAREVAGELRQTAPERAVEFHIPDGVEAVGDAALLQVALSNLLANAWKFTGKRRRSDDRIRRSAGGSRRVYFVRDNGAGFDMAYADKVVPAVPAFARNERISRHGSWPGDRGAGRSTATGAGFGRRRLPARARLFISPSTRSTTP